MDPLNVDGRYRLLLYLLISFTQDAFQSEGSISGCRVSDIYYYLLSKEPQRIY